MQLTEGLLPLWRRDGESQLGVDPRHAVVLKDLSPQQQRALDILASTDVTVAELAQASGATRAQTRALLDRLRRSGSLRDSQPPSREPSRSGSSVAIMGGDSLALMLARVLTGDGIAAVSLLDTTPVAPSDVSSVGYHPGDVGRPRSTAALAHLRHARADVDTRAPTQPDIVVLVENRVSVPFRSSGLMREDVAHLSVVIRELDIVVGPAVRPGRDACLRCLDLHRLEADPCWPALATQLAVAPAPRHALSTLTAAAGLAAASVDAMLSGSPDAPWQLTTEVAGTQLPRRRWAPHPECGCGAHEYRSR